MKKIQPLLLAFVAGLLLGAILPNLFEGTAWKMNGLSDLMLLERYLSGSVDSRRLFLYLMKQKGSILLWMVFLGLTVFGSIAAVVAAAALGGYVGLLLSSMLKLGGIRGFLLGIGLLLPQYFLYIPVFLIFLSCCFGMSLNRWKKRQVCWKEYRNYLIMVVCLFLLSAGAMALESYVNPWLVTVLLKYLKFF